jgi:hypothetical protein
MKAIVAFLALGLATMVAGFGLWSAGRLERRIVEAHRRLLTLDSSSPDRDGQLERTAQRLGALFWTAGVADELRELRAAASYWNGDHSTPSAESGASAAPASLDPALALIAANLSFRRIGAASERTAAVQLDAVIGRYAEILRQRPQWFDVAYNYEFAARTRNRLVRVAPPRPDPGRDHRVPPNIHGAPGAPAEDADLSDLKIIVPQRTDERRQQPDAGVGGAKPRKG